MHPLDWSLAIGPEAALHSRENVAAPRLSRPEEHDE